MTPTERVILKDDDAISDDVMQGKIIKYGRLDICFECRVEWIIIFLSKVEPVKKNPFSHRRAKIKQKLTKRFHLLELMMM